MVYITEYQILVHENKLVFSCSFTTYENAFIMKVHIKGRNTFKYKKKGNFPHQSSGITINMSIQYDFS